MKENKIKKNFDHLFYTMLQEKQVEEKAIQYLHDKKKIAKAIIYNELLPKKILGYSPERKALAFPLVRGFLIVGIQYLATESHEIHGHFINEGQEYVHEDSDLETGLFNLQRNFRDVLITSSILDLLSTDLGGVSLPIAAGFKQLQLFSDINTTICFKNSNSDKAAAKKIIKILPNANIVTLPRKFNDINHFLLEKGQETVTSFFTEKDKDNRTQKPKGPRKGKNFELVNSRYFINPGPENTEATLKAALQRSKALQINKVLVSSCSGKTAFKALDLFGDRISLIIVTHVTGFKKPDHQELAEKDRKLLMERGATVLTAQHAFGGVGRAFRNKTGTYQIDEVIAYTLRTFGHGTKVAVEMALMATDAGLIRTDEDVISIGGTATGVDTALLLRPAHTQNFFDMKIKEIICKPLHF